jgi:hypothetical protein
MNEDQIISGPNYEGRSGFNKEVLLERMVAALYH